MAVARFYSDEAVDWRALQRAAKLYPQLSIATELCYNVELTGEHEEVSKRDKYATCRSQLSVCPAALSLCRSRSPLQAAAVSVQSRRRFSSGCSARHCRQSRCRRRRSSQRAAGRSWWRSDPGTITTIQSDHLSSSL